jgi:AcrR family transcriptional regulator
MESALIKLLQQHEFHQIHVTDICKVAEVNRTTFYANYLDIFDLADAVQKSMEEEVLGIMEGDENSNFLNLFRHIKENPIFYKTYFKLNVGGKFRFAGYDMKQALSRYDNQYIDYHIAFFGNGLNAIIKKWLENGCRETPEEIFSILQAEYTRHGPEVTGLISDGPESGQAV